MSHELPSFLIYVASGRSGAFRPKLGLFLAGCKACRRLTSLLDGLSFYDPALAIRRGFSSVAISACSSKLDRRLVLVIDLKLASAIPMVKQ
jgi:hypothetical protein